MPENTMETTEGVLSNKYRLEDWLETLRRLNREYYQSNDDKIHSLITTLKEFPIPLRTRFLQQITLDSHQNALMLLLSDEHTPREILNEILSIIHDLPIRDKGKIFTQVDREHEHLLQIAMRYHPEFIEPLLEEIITLKKSDRLSVLRNKNEWHFNPLNLAISLEKPRVAKGILYAMATLKPNQQAQILAQVVHSEGHSNSLMLALKHCHEILVELFVTMYALKRKKRYQLLNHQDEQGFHSLMLAIQYYPEALPLLFDSIRGLNKKEQIKILTHQSKEKEALIMITWRHNPVFMKEVLTACSELLPFNAKRPLFKTLLSLHTPSDIWQLLKAMILPDTRLTAELLLTCLSEKNQENHPMNIALELMGEKFEWPTSFCEAEFKRLQNAFKALDTACPYVSSDALKLATLEYYITLQNHLLSPSEDSQDSAITALMGAVKECQHFTHRVSVYNGTWNWCTLGLYSLFKGRCGVPSKINRAIEDLNHILSHPLVTSPSERDETQSSPRQKQRHGDQSVYSPRFSFGGSASRARAVNTRGDFDDPRTCVQP